VHPAAAPRIRDQAALDEPRDGEMHMQPVPARMPLGHPQIREPIAAETDTQRLEETRHITTQGLRLVAADPRVRQRPQTVQPVRSAVPADLSSRPPRRFRLRAIRIRRSRPAAQILNASRLEAPARFPSLGIQRQYPSTATLSTCAQHREPPSVVNSD
jgi:hypothetical protein